MWLARRFVGPISRRAALLLALAPLIFTGKAILLGRLYGPADLYYQQEPWSRLAAEHGVTKVANPILSDLAFANLPWRAAVRESLANGRLPFWNRYVLGGTPLLAAAQAAIFHPSTWIGILLPVPLSWTFSCAFTLFLALLSAFLFFRDFELSELAAAVGAVGWGFSTYVVFWDGWSVGPSTATIPLLLLGLRRIAAAAPGGIGLTVVSLLLMIAGGHPESWLHCAAAAGVFFVWELLRRPRSQVLRALGRAAGAGALALLLSGPQLFPLLEAIPHTAEYRARRAALSSGKASQSVTAGEAAARMLPALLPFAHGIYGKSPVQSERADGSGMPLAYAGALLFPLATIGLFARRRPDRGSTIFILYLLAGLLAGASAPGLIDLLTRLPGFSMALNYRLVFLAGLGLSGLAAFGAEAVLRGEARRAAGITAGWAILIFTAFLFSLGVFHDRGLSPSFVGFGLAAQVIPLFFFAAAAALPRGGGRRAASAALLLLFVERGLEMSGTYPTLPASALAPPLPALEVVTGSRLARVVAAGDTFRPNAAELYGIEDVRGYESVQLARLADTFPLWSNPQFASFNRVDDLNVPFLAFLNARYAVAPPDAAELPGWRLARRTETMAIFENPRALPRAFVPKRIHYEPNGSKALSEMSEMRDFSQTVWVEEARESSGSTQKNGEALLELRASGPDLIVAADASGQALVATSIPAWPGWRAEVSGRDLPLNTVNHAFVGFFVPPGRSLVRLHYRPRSWEIALAAFLLGLALSASTTLRRARR